MGNRLAYIRSNRKASKTSSTTSIVVGPYGGALQRCGRLDALAIRSESEANGQLGRYFLSLLH